MKKKPFIEIDVKNVYPIGSETFSSKLKLFIIFKVQSTKKQTKKKPKFGEIKEILRINIIPNEFLKLEIEVYLEQEKKKKQLFSRRSYDLSRFTFIQDTPISFTNEKLKLKSEHNCTITFSLIPRNFGFIHNIPPIGEIKDSKKKKKRGSGWFKSRSSEQAKKDIFLSSDEMVEEKESESSNSSVPGKSFQKVERKSSFLPKKRTSREEMIKEFSKYLIVLINYLEPIRDAVTANEKNLETIKSFLNPEHFFIKMHHRSVVDLKTIEKEIKKYNSVIKDSGFDVKSSKKLNLDVAKEVLKNLLKNSDFITMKKKVMTSFRKTDVRPEVVKKQKQIKPQKCEDSNSMLVEGLDYYLEGIFLGTYTGKVTVLQSNTVVPVDRGVLVFPDKSYIYEGNFLRGKKHGFGEFFMKGKKEYVIKAFWENNFPVENGICEIQYPNGDKYHGVVFCESRNPAKIEFSDFKREGNGVFFCKKKNFFYFGSFHDNFRSGFGICDFLRSGERYIGSFKAGRFDGRGCYSYLDGSLYFGNFLAGKKHSNGHYYLSNGFFVEGQWNKNKLEKTTIVDDSLKYGGIHKEVLAMIKSEIKRTGSQKRQSDTKRNDFLWYNILDMEKLKEDFKTVEDVWNNLGEKELIKIISDKKSYVFSILKMFCDYFRAIYKQRTIKSIRNNLLYGKDDVNSFGSYMKSAIFKTIRHFNVNSTADKIRVQSHKKNISKCVTRKIVKNVYEILFDLYKKEYMEKEILLRLKIDSIFLSMKNLSHEKRVVLLKLKMKSINTDDNVNKIELDGLKYLLKSIDNKDVEEQMKNEKDFLEKMLLCLSEKFKMISQDTQKIDEEIQKYTKLPQKIELEKDFLSNLESSLINNRLGLINVMCKKKLNEIKEAYKIVSSKVSDNLPSSFNDQISSFIMIYDTIGKLIDNTIEFIDMKEIGDEKCHLDSLILEMESINIAIDYFFVPELQRVQIMKMSIRKSIKSITKVLNKILHEDSSSVLQKLNNSGMGDFRDILKKTRELKIILGKLQLSESGNDIDFVLERWDSIYFCTQGKFTLLQRDQLTAIEKKISSVINQIMKVEILKKSKFVQAFVVQITCIKKDINYLQNNFTNELFEIMVNDFQFRSKSNINFFNLILEKNLPKNEVLFKILQTTQKINANFLNLCRNFQLNEMIHDRREKIIKHLIFLQEEEEGKDFPEIKKKVSQLEIGGRVLSGQKTIFAKSKISETFKLFETGCKAVQISLEHKKIQSELRSISRNITLTEVNDLLEESLKKINKRAISKKIETIDFYLNDKEDNISPFILEVLGVNKNFIPVQHDLDNYPYKKSIEILNRLSNKSSIDGKLEILNKFEKTLYNEIKSNYLDKFPSKKKKRTLSFDEDDILPVVLYTLLNAKLNHYAEYHFLKDWSNSSQMLTRYNIFFKYIKQLNPYARTQHGELISVIGNIISPIKYTIKKLLIQKKSEKVKVRWLIDLFNYIYCAIGFTRSSVLEIRNQKLKERIRENETALFILSGIQKACGFQILDDTEFEDRLIIEFENKFSPDVYKFCAEEILKEYKEFLE